MNSDESCLANVLSTLVSYALTNGVALPRLMLVCEYYTTGCSYATAGRYDKYFFSFAIMFS